MASSDTGREQLVFVYVYGWRVGAYQLNIRGKSALYQFVPDTGAEQTEWESRSLTNPELEDFMRELDDLGIFKWKEEYFCPTTDGIVWVVRMKWNGKTLESTGGNQFPEGFHRLQAAVAKLTRKPFGFDPMAVKTQECDANKRLQSDAATRRR